MHERLAADATANVHLGWLVRQQRLVAVKRLHPHHVADELGIARVRKEARLAMSIDHPNVVATLGVVRHPNELLATLEYVPGASLAEITGVAREGLAPHLARAIAAGALRGLDAAHDARDGAVARCVTSRSVLVGEDGVPRVIDFAIPGPTMAGALERKLPYASPEQLGRSGIDARRDVYAASVVLWEALTGRSLFRGPTVAGTLRKILCDTIPPPSRAAPWIEPELDAIVMRGLARDPNERHASAGAMAFELERSSCATTAEVARALAAMDLVGIRRRHALADAVREREAGLPAEHEGAPLPGDEDPPTLRVVEL